MKLQGLLSFVHQLLTITRLVHTNTQEIKKLRQDLQHIQQSFRRLVDNFKYYKEQSEERYNDLKEQSEKRYNDLKEQSEKRHNDLQDLLEQRDKYLETLCKQLVLEVKYELLNSTKSIGESNNNKPLITPRQMSLPSNETSSSRQETHHDEHEGTQIE